MNTIKKANVEHKCEICNETIKKGDEYLCITRGSGVNSYNVAICKKCSFRREQYNYNIYTLRDCNSYENIYRLIALDKKHTIKEFQDEINRIKELKNEEICRYGDDWSIIQENINSKFNWFEIGFDADAYLEF